MKDLNATVGIYDSHELAAEAVRVLNKGGFPMNKVSVVGRELERIEDVKGYYTWKDPAKRGAGIGAFWGSLFGVFVGVGFLALPGIGRSSWRARSRRRCLPASRVPPWAPAQAGCSVL
jgi:hypothetical protein